MRLPHVGGAPQQQQARGQQRSAGARGSGGGGKGRRKQGKRANITVARDDAAVVVHNLPLGDCQQTALCGDTKGVLTRVLQTVPTAEAPPRITHIYHVGAGYVASETTPTRGFVPGLPACSSQ